MTRDSTPPRYTWQSRPFPLKTEITVVTERRGKDNGRRSYGDKRKKENKRKKRERKKKERDVSSTALPQQRKTEESFGQQFEAVQGRNAFLVCARYLPPTKQTNKQTTTTTKKPKLQTNQIEDGQRVKLRTLPFIRTGETKSRQYGLLRWTCSKLAISQKIS